MEWWVEGVERAIDRYYWTIEKMNYFPEVVIVLAVLNTTQLVSK